MKRLVYDRNQQDAVKIWMHAFSLTAGGRSESDVESMVSTGEYIMGGGGRGEFEQCGRKVDFSP